MFKNILYFPILYEMNNYGVVFTVCNCYEVILYFMNEYIYVLRIYVF